MSAEPGDPFKSPAWPQRPLDWARNAGESASLLAALALRERRRRRRRAMFGGSLATVLLFALAWSVPRPPAGQSPASTLASTARPPLVSGPERSTLPDGTRVELMPGSELAVRFAARGPGPREVTLVRGEAHFDVARNPARPFVVIVGSARFRAVGTAFSVALAGETAEMHVTEGRVAVDTPASPEPLAIVTAGHCAVVPASGLDSPRLSAVSPAMTGERFAWRVPRIEFDETPLAEVVAQLNRHGRTRLRLIGRDLQRVEITGALRADNVEPLLRSLETNYGIRVSRLPGGEIGLESAR
jgi:transmembrane sensor